MKGEFFSMGELVLFAAFVASYAGCLYGINKMTPTPNMRRKRRFRPA